MSVSTNFPGIKPSLLLDFANVKALDPRITFTRTTTATYYDGATTAKAEENLLQQSQTFGNAYWTNNIGTTITSSTETAPDGTSTATKFTANNGVTSAYIGKNNTGITLTNALGTIDLSTGSTNTTFGTFDTFTATEFPSGSGWYRIVVEQDGYFFSFHAKAAEYTYAGVQVTANTVRMYACNQSGSTTLSPAGDGTDGILIWGAQLEQRSAVSSYTPTTTQPITNYIPVLQTAASGVARFDHNPTTGESLGLLVEEQRTNICLQSEDFSTTWSLTRGNTTTNTIVAPDGTLTGDKLIPSTDNDTHRIVQTVTTSAGSWTFSAYLKKGEYSGVEFRIADGTSTVTNSGARTTVDLLTGSLSSTSFYGANATAGSASIVDVGNDWYRVTVTVTVTSSASNLQGQMWVQSVAGTLSYAGNGYSGLYVWGAQIEAGAFPTSYIATTSASVTRNADAASMTGTNFSSWFNNAEGTFYSEAVLRVTDGTVLSVNDGSTSNVMSQLYRFGTQMRFWVVSTGTDQATVNTSVSGQTKQASAYKFNDIAQSVNGATVSTDTSAIIPVVSQFNIGLRYTSNNFNSTIKKLAYYPSRLTDAQLQALTS